jgi:hypothetical protein
MIDTTPLVVDIDRRTDANLSSVHHNGTRGARPSIDAHALRIHLRGRRGLVVDPISFDVSIDDGPSTTLPRRIDSESSSCRRTARTIRKLLSTRHRSEEIKARTACEL